MLPFPSWGPHPLLQLGSLGERCKLPSGPGRPAELGCQMVSDAFWAEKSASGDNNYMQFEVFCETVR